jgi:hypothetical protein
MPTKPRAKESRAGILETIINPLRFFALVVLVVEGALLFVATRAEPQNQVFLFCAALTVIVLTGGAVFVLATRAPEHPIDLEVLADKISEEVWFSMDGALANLESEQEQAEAWVLLVKNAEQARPGEASQKGIEVFRSAFVTGIISRAGKGEPSLKQEIARLKASALTPEG